MAGSLRGAIEQSGLFAATLASRLSPVGDKDCEKLLCDEPECMQGSMTDVWYAKNTLGPVEFPPVFPVEFLLPVEFDFESFPLGFSDWGFSEMGLSTWGFSDWGVSKMGLSSWGFSNVFVPSSGLWDLPIWANPHK